MVRELVSARGWIERDQYRKYNIVCSLEFMPERLVSDCVIDTSLADAFRSKSCQVKRLVH
jgi:hypothetical protein